VRAAPADGAANKAVVRVIADALAVAPSTVELLTGASGRLKRLAVAVRREVVERRWPGLLTRDE
jgi:uncharacterized protein YggU (UPF0235/DUF167 family)